MSDKKAEWAARLICDPTRDETVDVVSADIVFVHEVVVEGDQVTTIATTQTTEPALLRALIKQIRKEHQDAKNT